MRAGNGIENFSKNVFHDGVMRERLPKNVYQKLKKSMQEGYSLSPDLADAVAQGMKEWLSNREQPIIPTGSNPYPVLLRKSMRPF